MRKTPLHSSPKKRRKIRHQHSAKVVADVCFMAGLGKVECSKRGDLHHLIPKQTLKREFPHGAVVETLGRRALKRGESNGGAWLPLDLILVDPRNLVGVCRAHHDAFHNARFHVPADRLPESVLEFARDYGMRWYIDRYYPESEAA